MPDTARAVWKPADRPDAKGALLIDSHVWIWFLDGEEGRMARGATELLRRVARGAGLVVSEMSVWEIANKASKGRLSLRPSTDEWIERATALPGYRFAMPDRATLLLSTRLPEIRRTDLLDPIDRMLLATAMRESLPLVTADRALVAYVRRTKRLSVCDVRR